MFDDSPPHIVLAFPVGEMTEAELRTHYIAVHRAIIILDNWICDRFDLSRKARHRKTQLSTNKPLDKQDTNGV